MAFRVNVPIVAALLAVGLASAAAADPMAPAPVTPSVGDAVPAGFDWSKQSEYTLPKDLYVPGDPLVLNDKNKASGQRLNFVACPVIRDSTPTPLWLVRYNGELYFLRAQQNLTGAVHHPQLLHQVMVEGIVSNEPRIGGGIVLNPVYVSVMPELDQTCTEMLPSEGYHIAFAKHQPGPSLQNPEQKAERAKARTELAARLDAASYTPDPVPHETRAYVVPFEFDGTYEYSYDTIREAVKFAKDVQAARIEVRGYRAAELLTNGQVLTERAGIEQDRATEIAALVTDYHFPKGAVQVSWDSSTQKPDGVSDFEKRRVTITVIPGPAATAQAAPTPKTP